MYVGAAANSEPQLLQDPFKQCKFSLTLTLTGVTLRALAQVAMMLEVFQNWLLKKD